MPFEVSNKAFAEAFGTPKDRETLTADFLQQLKRYLSDKQYDSAVAIKSWLTDRGKLSTFTCREDMLQSMMRALRRHATPYILVKETGGGFGFLIRLTDTELVKKISRRILKEKSSYCAVTTGEKVNELYLRSKEQDKNMLQICGLTEEESLYLEEECNTILPQEAIGIDRLKDGTYMLTCHGKTAISEKSKRKSLNNSLAETLVVMNGASAESMKKRAQNMLRYREAKAVGFPDRNGEFNFPVWIVGSGDRFVKSTPKGFELGHAIEAPGNNVILKLDLRVKKDDQIYESRLNAALAHILNKMCLYTEPDVIAHFRTKRSYTQEQAVVGEQQFVMMADAIICDKIKRDSITHMEGKWEHKLKHYQKEMGRLMIGARDSKIPKGYTKEDVLRLQKVAETFQLNMNDFGPAIDKIMQIEVYTRDAAQSRVMDIDRQIAKYRGEDHDRNHTGRTNPAKDNINRG